MRLKDKVALVTGAGSGIGRASAMAFAREGAKVVVADYVVEGGEETVRLIKAAGGDAMLVGAFLSPEERESFAAALEAALSGSGLKEPVSAPGRGVDEMKERGTRRSLYAARDLKVGEDITEDMFITLRPVRGVEPKDLLSLLGKKLKRPLSAREPLTDAEVE